MSKRINRYRNGPFVQTGGNRPTWSFTAYLEECYEHCGRSTAVLDAATHEWVMGKKDIRNVKNALKQKTIPHV